MSSPTFLLIDGSYFCFYRYFSILAWWKSAYPENPLIDPFQNEIFVEKFKKTFIDSLQKIPKKLNIDKNITPITFVGKDCKREHIWRNSIFDKYKTNRATGGEDGFMGGPFFKMAYEDNLFKQGNITHILKHPHLEADDCIAISVRQLLQMYPECSVYIITSDKDYLQLAEPRVRIFDLKFKELTAQKSCLGDAKKDLFCKIVMGDVSDNIPSVIKKCGPKTAQKCYENPAYFEERMKKENAYDIYERNRTLVDFDCIPEIYKHEFMVDCFHNIGIL